MSPPRAWTTDPIRGRRPFPARTASRERSAGRRSESRGPVMASLTRSAPQSGRAHHSRVPRCGHHAVAARLTVAGCGSILDPGGECRSLLLPSSTVRTLEAADVTSESIARRGTTDDESGLGPARPNREGRGGRSSKLVSADGEASRVVRTESRRREPIARHGLRQKPGIGRALRVRPGRRPRTPWGSGRVSLRVRPGELPDLLGPAPRTPRVVHVGARPREQHPAGGTPAGGPVRPLVRRSRVTEPFPGTHAISTRSWLVHTLEPRRAFQQLRAVSRPKPRPGRPSSPGSRSSRLPAGCGEPRSSGTVTVPGYTPVSRRSPACRKTTTPSFSNTCAYPPERWSDRLSVSVPDSSMPLTVYSSLGT